MPAVLPQQHRINHQLNPPPMRRPLPYRPDLGNRLREQSLAADKALWLRLGNSSQELFCAFPAASVLLSDQCAGSVTEIVVSSWPDFWKALPALLNRAPAKPELSDLPFRGGLLGYLGYGNPDNLPGLAFPGAFMGLYPHFIHIDHARKSVEEVILPGFEEATARWKDFLQKENWSANPAASRKGFTLSHPFHPLTPPKLYQDHFQRIQAYLHHGDCYQVNYAQAFRATCKGSSAAAMEQLLAVSNPAYAAWISLPEGDVLSLSPELFLRVENDLVTTKPIKGTAPRSASSSEDKKLRQALQNSSKDKAENLMIVDLLRHDIGQHAETGSVQVEKLFEVESLPQVHHLVSTVTARLKKGSHTLDLVRDSFPGGSITGAPKKRAMEIIAELEPTPRSIYCGSIGFINADGDAQFNIAIRTLLRLGDELYAWAGGGIVADSKCAAEYQECFDKIGALMRALENMDKED